MYRNEKVNAPILGLIENMAWFTPAALTSDTATGLAFINLAQAVVTVVNRRNKEQPATQIVGMK